MAPTLGTDHIDTTINDNDALTISLGGPGSITEGLGATYTVALSNNLDANDIATVHIAINLPGGLTGAEAADFTQLLVTTVANSAAATPG